MSLILTNLYFKVLDSDKTAEILLELEDDLREYIKSAFAKEIAEELDELDTNDAADIIAELSQDLKAEVISELNDLLQRYCRFAVMMRTLQGIDGEGIS
jgi:Mg/Co/Ni transporter MgtE